MSTVSTDFESNASISDPTNKRQVTSEWTKYLIFVSLSAALSSFTYGFNISVIDAPKQLFEMCRPYRIEQSSSLLPPCIIINDFIWSFVVAAFCAGGLIGALACTSLVTRYGLKRVLFFNNILYILGSFFFSVALYPWMLVLGRFFAGAAGGISTVLVPMYLSDIATDRLRGTLCTFHQGGIVVGILVSQLFALGLSTESGWRILFAIGGLISIVQMCLLAFCPESPKHLARTGDRATSKSVLKNLRGSDYYSSDDDLESNGKSEAVTISVRQLMSMPVARKSLLIGLLYHIMQQLSGINVFFYYSSTIFSDIAIPSQYLAIGICVFNVIISGISIWLMDRLGRRPLTLISSGIMALSCFLITAGFYFEQSMVVALSALVFVCSFGIGMGPVPWVILQDIFPASSINAGTSLGIGFNWACNMLVALAVLPLVKLIGVTFVFVPFGILLSLFFIFTMVFIRETKGLPSTYLN